MKPRIFLASSIQAKPRMDTIVDWLKDWDTEPLPWDKPGLFNPGDFILERLLEISQEVDAAIVCFGDEDKEWYHKDAQPQPRDNVLIEYGIFASRVGRERVAICRNGDPKNASDLGGLIFLQIDRTKKSLEDGRNRLRLWVKRLPELAAEARKAEDEKKAAASRPVASGIDVVYGVPGSPERQIRIQTGALKDIRNVDVIVSSENTDLQPARFYDRSMSGTLRYLDAERNKISQRVTRDASFDALTQVLKDESVTLPVMPGSVVAVPTHGLASQGVKFLFVAAVVEGKVGLGYQADETAIDDAIRRAFERFAELKSEHGLTSMLFPMFGAGSGRMTEDAAARRVVAAINGLLPTFPDPAAICLYAHIESHRQALRNAAQGIGWRAQ